MPLIACPDCNTEISDLAPVCPKCGRPKQAAANPGTKADPARVRNDVLFYTVVGFIVGCGLTWFGCNFGEHNIDPGRNYAICGFGGAIFAILGALVGKAIGRSRKV